MSCKIPVTLISLDSHTVLAQPCEVVMANLGGCAVRSSRPIPTGTPLQLDGLPAARPVTARVVQCISLGEFEKLWLLGLGLDEPGNVWGIEVIPEDWREH